ncbi:hypothetical protein A2851_00660 [Candidatus Kaiserbacteria bacterium RIFCSPHIGHO2_01_FULL_53_29]|uniref:AI-2E family transporter n=1 Tax=Candidatus Kaiserbacteria bacterium RIFCSPHIGHO2_01_FULL_53_29 TaxID=1798480 RepID=A0A1F6CTM5_9BACT|nr:MAG: hypothetical protein A2851_00660 [Candidatus Kaiserbacteria bacterium RIFCSPHIGHO2_01_FULL_53_29]
MHSVSFQHYFLLALLLLVGSLTFFIVKPFLAPVILGIVFAVVLHPLYFRTVRYFHGLESLAALATVLVTSVVIFMPVAFLGVQVLNEAQQMYASFTGAGGQSALQSTLRDLGPTLDAYIPGTGAKLAEFSASADEYVKLGLTWMIQHLGVAFSGITALFLDLFIFFFTFYYLLRDGVRLKQRLVEISPLADRDDLKIFERLEVAVNSVVKGRIAIAILQGALTGVGFMLFGVPNAVFWGVVGSVASLLPPFGTSLVIVPAVGYLLLQGHISSAIGLAVWGGVAVGLVDNVLAPKLMSHGTQLHPLLVLLSVLGGLVFFGPVGIFLGPLTASLFTMLLSLHTDFWKSERRG